MQGTSSGIFKSTDGGENWAAINTDLPTSACPAPSTDRFVSEITSLVVDPTNANLAYAATASSPFELVVHRVVKTEDGGATWIVKLALPGEGILALALDATHPMTVYAGTTLS